MNHGDSIFYRTLADRKTGMTRLFYCTDYDCYTYSTSVNSGVSSAIASNPTSMTYRFLFKLDKAGDTLKIVNEPTVTKKDEKMNKLEATVKT